MGCVSAGGRAFADGGRPAPSVADGPRALDFVLCTEVGIATASGSGRGFYARGAGIKKGALLLVEKPYVLPLPPSFAWESGVLDGSVR